MHIIEHNDFILYNREPNDDAMHQPMKPHTHTQKKQFHVNKSWCDVCQQPFTWSERITYLLHVYLWRIFVKLYFSTTINHLVVGFYRLLSILSVVCFYKRNTIRLCFINSLYDLQPVKWGAHACAWWILQQQCIAQCTLTFHIYCFASPSHHQTCSLMSLKSADNVNDAANLFGHQWKWYNR